jgi:L-fuconate dehydratase
MITHISTRDARYPIGSGHGSDAIHKDPVYSYAVTLLTDDKGRSGSGLAFTLGEGNDLVCKAAEFYASRLQGRCIEEIMANFGALQKEMADEQQFRWLGPHKGVVQLALASVTNACWDLWAKTRGLPLWKLLLELSPAEVAATLDLSYL